ncbi:hypothetical protein PCE1_001752 [Barthelona sp. PCE]
MPIKAPHRLSTSGFGRDRTQNGNVSYSVPYSPSVVRRKESTVTKIAREVLDKREALTSIQNAVAPNGQMSSTQFRSALRTSGVDLTTLAIDRAVNYASQNGVVDLPAFMHKLEEADICTVPERIRREAQVTSLPDENTVSSFNVKHDPKSRVLERLRDKVYFNNSKLSEAFMDMDDDGDHYISRVEMKQHLNQLLAPAPEEDAAVDSIINDLCTENKEIVKFNDFAKVIEPPYLSSPVIGYNPREPVETRPVAPRAQYKRDDFGRINVMRNRHVHRSLSSELLDLNNPTSIAHSFEALDSGKGSVSEGEFKQALSALGVRNLSGHMAIARDVAQLDSGYFDYKRYLNHIGAATGIESVIPASSRVSRPPRALQDHGPLLQPKDPSPIKNPSRILESQVDDIIQQKIPPVPIPAPQTAYASPRPEWMSWSNPDDYTHPQQPKSTKKRRVSSAYDSSSISSTIV